MALVDIAKGLFPFKPPHYEGDDPAMKRWATAMESYLGERLNQYEILLRGGLRWENLRAKLILGVTVPAGGTPTTVSVVVHNLGKVPEFISFLGRTTGLRYFVDAADKTAWTTRTLQFKEETGGSGTVDVFVF